jgi:Tat protein secretion system quality control protein TatD with DNase activity
VAGVAKTMAALRGMRVEDVIASTGENALRILSRWPREALRNVRSD